MTKQLFCCFCFFSFHLFFSGQSKLIDSPKDCNCDNVKKVLNLEADCDTLYFDTRGCGGALSVNDTVEGKIYFKELYNIGSAYTGEINYWKESIKEDELFTIERLEDTTTKKIYTWYKSPFTKADTLIHVETRIKYLLEDRETGEKIATEVWGKEDPFCQKCDRSNFNTWLAATMLRIHNNIKNNDSLQFKENIALLFSLAVMEENNSALISFYEFGLQLKTQNENLWRIWEKFHQRLLNKY